VDDFCIFGNDKERIKWIREQIVEHLDGLRLKIHEGKSRIYTVKEGVEFLGFRHLDGTVRVRKENVRRFRRRMKKLQKEYAAGRIKIDRVKESLVSWNAHAANANSLRLRQELIPVFAFKKGERAELEPCVARRFLEQ